MKLFVNASIAVILIAPPTLAEDDVWKVNWNPTLEVAQAFAEAVEVDETPSKWNGSKNDHERQCNPNFLGGFGPLIYTPLCLAESKRVGAARDYRDYTVTENDIAPTLIVVAKPEVYEEQREVISWSGVLLMSTDKTQRIKPKRANTFAAGLQNKMGWQGNYPGVMAYFAPEDVEALRKMDKKGEFYILMKSVTWNRWVEYKVKTKHFKHLR